MGHDGGDEDAGRGEQYRGGSGFDGTGSDLSSASSTRKPPRITEAQESFEAQQRVRIRKYALLMGFRIPALVIAVIVYSTWNNVWAALIIVAISIPLPWIAVLIANDAPPRRKDKLRRYERPAHDRQLEPRTHHTIEG
ncbi:DUF3099 domain-containing protein [Tomitella fengzijianii]|uniref:DUF3099 domain-containing protein n=1 Tax=Tomitella fengzijianii TaxID=2597660 RepID=A0A516X3G3_9ACTN|nr:DUF3099 domain-containing protein [Tomitella fengzijianii]QDQ97610.1 DUF3099 domain-containing protein [Tomitella fengzijianii]